MYHSRFDEIKLLVNNNINVLLAGEAGSGKTTIIRNVSEALNLEFYSIGMTKQTTLNAILGFISLNGDYIPSQLRKAVEFGGLMLLDEIDAGDPNTLLCLNSLENGYLAFPDGVVQVHKDFRLVATANPADQHNMYTGRSKLDAATLDRFDEVRIDRDPALEEYLTDKETLSEIKLMRDILSSNNESRTISMRDSIRLFQRKSIGLDSTYSETLLGDSAYIREYNDKVESVRPVKPITPKKQHELETVEDLWSHIQQQADITLNQKDSE